MAALKLTEPLAVTERSLPPLFCNTSPEPASPLTMPPTLYVSDAEDDEADEEADEDEPLEDDELTDDELDEGELAVDD